MKTRVLILATLALTMLATTAFAGPRVNHRQTRQHARIHQGVASGELTRYEAHRARAGQRHVQRLENRALRDGDLSARERFRLEHVQDVQSRRIYRLKHNGRTR
jgi:hypothetical protein